MFTRYALSMAAALLLASCAMAPAQPVATPPPSTPETRPAAVVSAPLPLIPMPASSTLAPTVLATPAAAAVRAFAPAAAVSSVVSPQPPVVMSTPKPAPKRHRLRIAKPTHDRARQVAAPKPDATTPPHAALAALTGRVTLTGSRGQSVSQTDVTQTLVYFVPATGNVPPRPGRYTVFTHDRHFDPRALAIPIGSTVTFTNLDDFRHNVYSQTPGSTFDLGYQPGGSSDSHTFTRAGLVLISCHVHRAMALNLLVLPTRFVVRLDADGHFALRVPAGPGTLHIWNPRARSVRMQIDAPAAGPISRTLDLIMPAMPTQLYVGGAP